MDFDNIRRWSYDKKNTTIDDGIDFTFKKPF